MSLGERNWLSVVGGNLVAASGHIVTKQKSPKTKEKENGERKDDGEYRF